MGSRAGCGRERQSDLSLLLQTAPSWDAKLQRKELGEGPSEGEGSPTSAMVWRRKSLTLEREITCLLGGKRVDPYGGKKQEVVPLERKSAIGETLH